MYIVYMYIDGIFIDWSYMIGWFIYVWRVCVLKIFVFFYFKVGGIVFYYVVFRGYVEVVCELLNYKVYVNGRIKVCVNNL